MWLTNNDREEKPGVHFDKFSWKIILQKCNSQFGGI